MKARIWTPRVPMHKLGPRKARGMGLRMAAAEVDRLRCFCLVFTRNTCWTESGHGLSHESHREEPRWIEPRDACNIATRWQHIITGADMQGVWRRRVPHACAGFPRTTASLDVRIIPSACRGTACAQAHAVATVLRRTRVRFSTHGRGR